MIDYEKLFKALKRNFPSDREKIEQIRKASSNRDSQLIEFLNNKVFEAKQGISTMRTRANISALRTLIREIEKNNRSKLLTCASKLIEQAAKVLMARQTTEVVINVVGDIVEKFFPVEISPEIRKGVSLVCHSVVVKPIGKVIKWHKDTACEMYDAARETWNEIKKENPSAGILKKSMEAAGAAIKTGTERIDDALTKFDSEVAHTIVKGKEVGKRIVEKANNSLDKICSSAAQFTQKTFEKTTDGIKKLWRKIW